MAKLHTLAFDADDTLWHNERFFKFTQAHFEALLAPYAKPDHLHARLLAAEKRNIKHYGFGIKGFVLSMIETALEVTDNAVPGAVIAELLTAGQDMLAHPIELLEGVEETLPRLAGEYRLIVVTKGDMLDQERKIAQSGLGEFFDDAHIVSDKTESTYRSLFGDKADGTMMIGNSMKSDVLPALAAGSWATFIPQPLAWDLEHADPPEDASRFRQISSMIALPDLLSQLT